MQFIPAGWQDTVALHIVAMDEALQQSATYASFTAATGRYEMLDNTYAIACNEMIDFIEAHFITIRGFDEFLKTDAQRIALEKG